MPEQDEVEYDICLDCPFCISCNKEYPGCVNYEGQDELQKSL